jgi:low affinity Fe/Cu permease
MPTANTIVPAIRNEKTASAALVDTIRRIGSHSAAFGIIAVYAVAWLIFSPGTFGWSAIATLAIWFMTLLITRTEHRDTEAIQAKLDELLRTHGEARDDLTAIDEKDVEEITAHRAKERENDALNTAKGAK